MEIEVNGVKAHYVDEGEGPVIVLLHGFTMSTHSWRFNIAPLAKRFRVIAVDLPGFGQSEKPRQFLYDMTGFARWVCDFLDALGVCRAAFVGNSMGGGVAYTVATTEPDRVSSLVLVDAVGYQPRNERFFIFRIMGIPWLGEFSTATLNGLAVRLILRTFIFHDPGFVTADVVREYIAPLKSAGGRAAALRTIRTIDFDAAPGSVPCRRPTLILWGDRDRIVPVSHAQLFARDLQDAKLHVFENAGHFPQVERAEAFNHEVETFVAAHP
ncbi:MAG: alpha/beta fold hydrolase [Deltaproteobacteria bacterium]|nr:alpha/beta fold hydrolase [Deltaproteobacteria bacterium]